MQENCSIGLYFLTECHKQTYSKNCTFVMFNDLDVDDKYFLYWLAIQKLKNTIFF